MQEFLRRYAVFHATSMQAMADPVPQAAYAYVHVANVDALSLSDVFALTNHLEDSWQRNRAIVWAAPGAQRSTSVGDLIYSYEDERLWVVQPVGFARSPASPEQLGLQGEA